MIGSTLQKKLSSRASVIPYTMLPHTNPQNKYDTWQLWFLLGEYAHKTPDEPLELTDIGGGVKKDENDLIAACRELHEESRGIFSKIINKQYLAGCPAIFQHSRKRTHDSIRVAWVKENAGESVMEVGGKSCIFVPVSAEWVVNAPCMFRSTQSTDKELSNLVWVSGQTFQSLLNGKSVGIDGQTYKMWEDAAELYKNKYGTDLVRVLSFAWKRRQLYNTIRFIK